MALLPSTEVRQRAAKIRCVFLDIDGVMTDGKLYLGPDGAEIKAVSVRDGLGIKNLLRAGIEVAVISGRTSEAMQRRLTQLGVTRVVMGNEDKLGPYQAVRTELGLTDAECAHMGDDTPDLPLLLRVGLALSVADAHPCALEAAHWVSPRRGGEGAVRDACDLILEAQGVLPSVPVADRTP